MSTDQANHMLDEPGLATPETLDELLTTHGVNLEADSRLHYRKVRRDVGIGGLVLAGLGPTQAIAVVLSGSVSLHLLAVSLLLGAISAAASFALMRRHEVTSAATETIVALVGCALAAITYGSMPEIHLGGLGLPSLAAGAIALLATGFVAASLIVSDERRASYARAAAPVIAVAGTFAIL